MFYLTNLALRAGLTDSAAAPSLIDAMGAVVEEQVGIVDLL